MHYNNDLPISLGDPHLLTTVLLIFTLYHKIKFSEKHTIWIYLHNAPLIEYFNMAIHSQPVW